MKLSFSETDKHSFSLNQQAEIFEDQGQLYSLEESLFPHEVREYCFFTAR